MPLDAPTDNIVIYDGDCFFCRNFIRLMNLKTTLGEVSLINARETEKVEALGIVPSSLNEGMAFISGDRRYFGADAMHHLALLSTSSPLFNRLNHAVFRHRTLAVLLYPVLKAGRRLSLFFAGKKQIA